MSHILQENLQHALHVAITSQQHTEKLKGFTSDSALLAGWKDNLKALQNGEWLEVVPKGQKPMSEIEKEVYAEVAEIEAKRLETCERELAFVKDNIDYPIELIMEELEDLDFWEHVSYVQMEKTDQKESGYQSFDFYVEPGDRCGSLYMKQDEDATGYHKLIMQWSVGDSGDSWSGFLLFPLKDGNYWKISYSC